MFDLSTAGHAGKLILDPTTGMQILLQRSNPTFFNFLFISHLTSEQPGSAHNFDVLSESVHDSKAGIVHIQYEQGLYRLVLDPMNCDRTSTNIDSFYLDCKVQLSPLVGHTLLIQKVLQIPRS